MKRKQIKLIVSTLLMLLASCGEPDTVVTNIVHSDGSVTRKIEMRSGSKLTVSGRQVPFDSTWSVSDTLKLSEKGDTTWIRRAVKLFKDVEGINLTYLSDSGVNREISRTASFKKRFRWFNTLFRFSERVEPSLLYGYPLEKFLTKDELDFYYLPQSISAGNIKGPDSTMYKILSDSAELKAMTCMWSGVVSEWIEEFSKLTAGRTGIELSRETLKSKEKEIVEKIEKEESNDSTLIAFYLGESNFKTFRVEADSAGKIMNDRLEKNLSFSSYTVQFKMPGDVVGTNGYINDSGELLWPVSSVFFLSQPYEMWAESKVPNWWAWAVSGLFLVFVFVGLMIRINKKG